LQWMRATSKCQLFVAYANAQGDLASQIRERNGSVRSHALARPGAPSSRARGAWSYYVITRETKAGRESRYVPVTYGVLDRHPTPTGIALG